ncbi:Uma2 family endonuclease [Streptomyces sp. NPDC088923]|uniref:Uma2 family endonuclease n=1 Tax=Streptomyces sp. NPDC088923 TaxID=3365913 RepID=UPI0037FC65F7
MSLTDAERLHSQLSRLEDAFPGYSTEIVEGSIVMSPVKPHHNRTMVEVWVSLRQCLASEWGLASDVAFLFDGENEFCPDIAVIPQADADENRSVYDPATAELVVEIVSPGSRTRDYGLKPQRYAAKGIPHYLIFDPYRAECVTYWNPSADGYLGRDTVPYGTVVKIDSPVLGEVRLPTDGLPVDPGA